MKFKRLFFIFFMVNIILNLLINNHSHGVNFSAESPAVILFNSNTGKIVYEKNAYEKMYPASTTKVMTAILAIENCNLKDTTTVSETSVILPDGYLGSDLQVGEVFTIKDLLYLLLLVSANDAANVLAEHIAGSVDDFSNMMNDKAKQIGCSNTNFLNAYGAHDDNHYSTAYDLALISHYAMQNEIFSQIVATTSYTISATNKHQERTLFNTNRLLHDSTDTSENIYYYEYATGIKTGYTTVAKNCLIASAKKDNIELIAVILGAREDENDYYSQRYSDAKNLFLTAFDNYSLHTIKKANDIIATIQLPDGNSFKKSLDLMLENDIQILMKNEDIGSELLPKVILYQSKADDPIYKGDILGKVTYTYEGISYTENLVSPNDVLTKEQTNNYFLTIAITFTILIAFTVFEIIRRKQT